MFRNKVFTGLIICMTALSACVSSPYYQKDITIPQNNWQTSFKPSFKFEVTDTTINYNLYFIIRHTEAYPFSNIWIWINTKKPGATKFERTRIEIPLAEPSGKWLGRGMGEIWEQRMPITHEGDKAILKKKGTWEISFEQNMRVNPLPEVLQVGLRIEKNNSNFSGK